MSKPMSREERGGHIAALELRRANLVQFRMHAVSNGAYDRVKLIDAEDAALSAAIDSLRGDALREAKATGGFVSMPCKHCNTRRPQPHYPWCNAEKMTAETDLLRAKAAAWDAILLRDKAYETGRGVEAADDVYEAALAEVRRVEAKDGRG